MPKIVVLQLSSFHPQKIVVQISMAQSCLPELGMVDTAFRSAVGVKSIHQSLQGTLDASSWPHKKVRWVAKQFVMLVWNWHRKTNSEDGQLAELETLPEEDDVIPEESALEESDSEPKAPAGGPHRKPSGMRKERTFQGQPSVAKDQMESVFFLQTLQRSPRGPTVRRTRCCGNTGQSEKIMSRSSPASLGRCHLNTTRTRISSRRYRDNGYLFPKR